MRRFLTDDDGATAIEYALIAAAMTVCLLVAMPFVETAIISKFTSIGTHVKSGV